MLTDETRQFRSNVLTAFGATGTQVEELLAYNDNIFHHNDQTDVDLPLEDEPFVAAWERYLVAAETNSALEVLKGPIVQLNFPIRTAISHDPSYRAIVRRGQPVNACPWATGLPFNRPEKITFLLHPTPGGRIPVIIVGDRDDFENVVRATTMRNEPGSVPRSIGAKMVAGFNNWERIWDYQRQWLEREDVQSGSADWAKEFKRLIQRKELYQDRFIIVSEGPYSGVSANTLGLTENEWNRLSLVIRLHHEGSHYFTKRLYGVMRNNLLDELIADYMGITGAIGRYRADWFLHFMGIEAHQTNRRGGRLEHYRGDPPLSSKAFPLLQSLAKAAAENLERADIYLGSNRRTLRDRGLIISALAHLTIEELASADAGARLHRIFGAS
ncbi:MAG TPA: hypothetical protein EYO39_03730 [Nitrospirales bacterium]|nr:hypothetical protein [Nitrospirales bacterium]